MLLTLAGLFAAMYVNVFLLGLQSQTVRDGDYAGAFFTSLCISVTNFFLFNGAVKVTFPLFMLSSGLGGPLGIISAIYVYKRWGHPITILRRGLAKVTPWTI